MLEDVEQMILNGATDEEVESYLDYCEEWRAINNDWLD